MTRSATLAVVGGDIRQAHLAGVLHAVESQYELVPQNAGVEPVMRDLDHGERVVRGLEHGYALHLLGRHRLGNPVEYPFEGICPAYAQWRCHNLADEFLSLGDKAPAFIAETLVRKRADELYLGFGHI